MSRGWGCGEGVTALVGILSGSTCVLCPYICPSAAPLGLVWRSGTLLTPSDRTLLEGLGAAHRGGASAQPRALLEHVEGPIPVH